MNARFLIILLLLAVIAAPVAAAGRVLVVINQDSSGSVDIGNYYAKKRSIPAKFVCRLRCPSSESVDSNDYYKLRSAIRNHLNKNKIKDKIDYIVLTKGVPIRASGEEGTYSVDSMLTVLWTDISGKFNNPYYRSKRPFRYDEQGFYLVTRLDGYTVADAKRLVDLSLAAKPQKSLFLFDLDPSRDKQPGYKFVNDNQREAIRLLKAKKHVCKVVDDRFPGREKGLMGYYTWGSNHAKFDHKAYVSNKFHPGAIAETVVSTSGRTFTRVKDGQSLIADLISSGVTGVKGYTNEPYATAIAEPQILFDRYTSGLNLAESFYAASPYLHWMDIVIGDPLCGPYAGKR